MKKLLAITSFVLITVASTVDANAQTAVAYKTTSKTVKTESPLYLFVTGVNPCCISLVTKTLKATYGVKSASYDTEKGLYVITANKGFKVSDAQQNVLNAGKEHDRKLNLKDRPEWALSVADATSNAGTEKKEPSCGKMSSTEGKSCCSKS